MKFRTAAQRNGESWFKTFRVYSGLEYVSGKMASEMSDHVRHYL